MNWNFDHSYAHLPELFYRFVEPEKVRHPQLIKFNKSLANELGLDPIKEEECALMFSGNQLPEGGLSLAQAYAGHQFGHFTMLGDGRAHLLGEQITPDGKRYDIQLKGSGRTPFSRRGDGRATLGPMLREYIISEAMASLGIPTTRSLAVVTTGEDVIRQTIQPGAILTRVGSSHLRVGTFEYASYWGSKEDVQTLADYTINRHYPHIKEEKDCYLSLLKEVMKSQASLIVRWQHVGFIHGVMNTDNMTMSGETIDYGPCAFMDTYDPKTVFSSIDREGRYAYGNQPFIGNWNLTRLAEALLPLIDESEEQAIKKAENLLEEYKTIFYRHYYSGMKNKLGIMNDEPKDVSLIDDLLHLMHKHQADFTNTFVALTMDSLCGMELFEKEEFKAWDKEWKARKDRQDITIDEQHHLMKTHNPFVIPRNHRVEEALEAAVNGNYTVMEDLLDVLSNPYSYNAVHWDYTLPNSSHIPYKTYCGT